MEMKKLYDRKEVPNSREGDNLSFIQIVVNELIFKIAIYYGRPFFSRNRNRNFAENSESVFYFRFRVMLAMRTVFFPSSVTTIEEVDINDFTVFSYHKNRGAGKIAYFRCSQRKKSDCTATAVIKITGEKEALITEKGAHNHTADGPKLRYVIFYTVHILFIYIQIACKIKKKLKNLQKITLNYLPARYNSNTLRRICWRKTFQQAIFQLESKLKTLRKLK